MNGLRATLNENETVNLVDNDQVKMTIKTLHKPDIEEGKKPPARKRRIFMKNQIENTNFHGHSEFEKAWCTNTMERVKVELANGWKHEQYESLHTLLYQYMFSDCAYGRWNYSAITVSTENQQCSIYI